MKISFVIPAHNEEGYIARCLHSIQAELAGNPCDAEIVVVNNASTDRTKEVALSFPGVRVVDEGRKGLTFARQAGLESSSGELVANIDADTMLPAGWVRTVVEEFRANETLAALSGPFIYYDLPVYARMLARVFYMGGFVAHVFNQYVLGVGAMMQGGNFVVRRMALERIGGFDTSIVFYGEDTDIARRVSRVGRVKWTFRLPMYASGRRLRQEGIVRMGARYAANYFSTTFFKRPVTRKYIDIRES